MANNTTKENVEIIENTQVDDLDLKRSKLQQKILKYFQNKEIAKERNEENKLIFEEIQEYFSSLPEEEIILQLENGEWAKLGNRFTIKEVLDKETLALELGMDKNELKSPWDFSKLAENIFKEKAMKEGLDSAIQSRNTFSKMISNHTSTETIIKLRMGKSKRKPKLKHEQK